MPKTFRKEFRTQGCTAHVRKRRSGKNSWNYEIRYRRNGYNITASANNLDQAKHKFIEMLGSAEKCVKNKECTIPSTFDKFANYFFEKFYKRKVGQSTFRVAMSNYKNHVVPHFGDMPLKSITADSVSDYEMSHAAERFPVNPPRNKEEYFYRSLFASHFPSDNAAKTVPSVPSVACSTAEALAWDKAFAGVNEPSGRAVSGVHNNAYGIKKT